MFNRELMASKSAFFKPKSDDVRPPIPVSLDELRLADCATPLTPGYFQMVNMIPSAIASTPVATRVVMGLVLIPDSGWFEKSDSRPKSAPVFGRK